MATVALDCNGLKCPQPILKMTYTFEAFKQIVFGIIIVIFLMFEPKGLTEIFSRLGRAISRKRRKEVAGQEAMPRT